MAPKLPTKLRSAIPNDQDWRLKVSKEKTQEILTNQNPHNHHNSHDVDDQIDLNQTTSCGSNVPKIGSWISLVSVASIRYTGQLSSINYDDYTLTLSHVRSHGTEDRPIGNFIKPNPNIFPEVEFMAVNIVSLDNIEFNDNNIMKDPAILNLSLDQQNSSNNRQKQMAAQQRQQNQHIKVEPPKKIHFSRPSYPYYNNQHLNNSKESINEIIKSKSYQKSDKNQGIRNIKSQDPNLNLSSDDFHMKNQKRIKNSLQAKYHNDMATNSQSKYKFRNPKKTPSYRSYSSDNTTKFKMHLNQFSDSDIQHYSGTIDFGDISPIIHIDTDPCSLAYDPSKGFFDSMQDTYENPTLLESQNLNKKTFGKSFSNFHRFKRNPKNPNWRPNNNASLNRSRKLPSSIEVDPLSSNPNRKMIKNKKYMPLLTQNDDDQKNSSLPSQLDAIEKGVKSIAIVEQ